MIRSLVGHAARRRAFVFVADFSLMRIARCDTGVIVFVVR